MRSDKSILEIALISDQEQVPYHLLELADSSRLLVSTYIETGECYVAKTGKEIIGVLVLDKINADTIEIKNIAVKESEQGKGFGKMLLHHAEKVSIALGFKYLLIGTGNSSIRQLRMYQKEGFEIKGLEKNFFLTHYAVPIFENGIQCKHKIILEKLLKSNGVISL